MSRSSGWLAVRPARFVSWPLQASVARDQPCARARRRASLAEVTRGPRLPNEETETRKRRHRGGTRVHLILLFPPREGRRLVLTHTLVNPGGIFPYPEGETANPLKTVGESLWKLGTARDRDGRAPVLPLVHVGASL